MSLSRTIAVVCSFAACLALLLTGCGGASSGSGSSAPTTISSSQINASAVALADSLSANIQAAGVSICSNAFQNNYFCTAPVAVTSLCTGGGQTTATGTVSDAWGYYASGIGSANLIVMPNACDVPGASLTLTGKPSLAATGNVTYVYAQPETFNMQETGDISYASSPTGSCSVNLNMIVYYPVGNITASCKVTGTLCGQTISQTC